MYEKKEQELQEIVVNTRKYLPPVAKISRTYVYCSSVQKR